MARDVSKMWPEMMEIVQGMLAKKCVKMPLENSDAK